MSEMHIAEIPYPSGVVHYRYSRCKSANGTAWIRHGLFRAYREDGTLASEGNYENGKEHGLWRDYHCNGQIAAEGTYAHGSESSIWRYWSEDGAPDGPTRA